MTIVTIAHCRSSMAKYCSSGMRDFAKKHNLDYLSFVKNGIDSDELSKLGDSMANRIVAIAKAEENDGQ